MSFFQNYNDIMNNELFNVISNNLILIGIIGIILYIAFAIPLMMIGNAKGYTGWFAWIPILNMILMIQIAKKPVWWIILFIIPIVNIIILIIIYVNFFKNIDKSALWILALLFFPFLLLIPYWSAASNLNKNQQAG